MPIEELPDGGVRINMSCPVCKHRFVTDWHPSKKGALPPFTKLNSITLQAMRKHFQEVHKP